MSWQRQVYRSPTVTGITAITGATTSGIGVLKDAEH